MYLASPYQQSLHQTINVPENNTTYTMEAWVRLLNTTPTTARLEITNHGSSQQFVDIPQNGEWTYMKVEDIMVTSGEVKIGFYVDSPGGTTLHIDGVRLMKE
ncbi:hypothetical protein G4V62_16245 [Bacillaceae bacterium SIJ1]|uniref:hypothetical protein n=1 Tax=Litoribacterium kuwaitense TaxID=1398745 RepID=UPI0013EDE50C|nr:hypothetical protein [Litoribacterium kuwaitense]NGP46422.1 hypothetical protein [Litoribacterium kuwaitense]